MSWTLALAALASGGVTDCPLARAPYSTRMPLSDIVRDPAARAVLDREAPGLVGDFTRPFGGGPLPEDFANIISPVTLLKKRPDGQALTARLDRALAAVPVTTAATRGRCARFDNERPALPATIRRPALLVFDKITGFRDGPSVDAANAALKAMAARRGWTLVSTDKAGVFNARDLARFEAVVWNNVSGDALTVPQRAAFRAWIERGGGYAGMHGSGGDPFYVWGWYADTLLGARFAGHPITPQFQAARVVVAHPARGVTRGLPAEWTMTDEWYSFATSPRSSGAHVLATLDEATYQPGELAMGDHPIAWTRCVGDGRAFYSAIGHRPENYGEPNSAKLLEQGIAWAMGWGETRCAKGKEIVQ